LRNRISHVADRHPGDPYDVTVIGAGMVGAMILRELSRFKLHLAVIEKEPQPGFGVTKSSLSYIHRNHMNPPGSLRASLCRGSQERFRILADELGLRYREADEINIALDAGQERQVRQRLDWAFLNGETGFRIISHDEVARLEPRMTRDFTFAIHSTDNGMIHPPEWAFGLVENARANGAEAFFDEEATSLDRGQDGLWSITTGQRTLRSRFVINAAGLYADRIAALAGDIGIRLFRERGTFAIFDSAVSSMLSHLIYVAGVDTSFSQAMGPTVHGNIILGLGRFQKLESRNDTRVTREELGCILEMGRRILPDLPEKDIITTFAGIKTTNNLAEKGDFYLGPSSISPTLIHALISSPGITASPGIARNTLDLLSNAGLDLTEKSDFDGSASLPFHFRSAKDYERSVAIGQNPACGHLVCRCEQVSEAEVREAARRGAKTTDGIKHLTRAGMGRCQGGFCGPLVLKLLAEELGVAVETITRMGEGSEEVSAWNTEDGQS